MIRMIIGALAALGLFSTAVHAETVHPPHGGQGDASHELRCPANSYLVGTNNYGGEFIDRLRIKCSPLRADGAGLPVNYVSEMRGGDGGGAFGDRLCGDGGVVTQMRIHLTSNRKQVVDVWMRCRNLANGEFVRGNAGPSSDTNVYMYPMEHECPPGEAGIGLALRYGVHINAVGLICGAIVKPTTRVVSQRARAPTPTGTSFIGSWDTVTEQGSRFVLVLSGGDGEIGGRFTLIGGPEIYGGTMQGKLESNGTGLRFTYRQNNGATGKGIFALSADGRTIEGVGTADNPPLMFTWKGTRK